MWVHTFRPLIIFPLIFWFSSPLSLTYSFWIFILLFYLACVLPLSYHVYISFRILFLKVIWCLKISAGNVKRKKTHLLWGWPTCWKGHLIPVVQRFLRRPPPQWTALLQRRATFAGGSWAWVTQNICQPIPAHQISAQPAPLTTPQATISPPAYSQQSPTVNPICKMEETI